MNETSSYRGGGWVIAQFALIAGVVVAPAAAPPPPAARAIGGLLVAGGLTISTLAALRLGQPSFTAYPRPRPEGKLTTDGLYAIVRHPIYLGLLIACVGYALLRGSPASMAVTAALAILLDRKSLREERWLAAQYPGYRAYAQQVPRLIPGSGDTVTG